MRANGHEQAAENDSQRAPQQRGLGAGQSWRCGVSGVHRNRLQGPGCGVQREKSQGRRSEGLIVVFRLCGRGFALVADVPDDG